MELNRNRSEVKELSVVPSKRRDQEPSCLSLGSALPLRTSDPLSLQLDSQDEWAHKLFTFSHHVESNPLISMS